MLQKRKVKIQSRKKNEKDRREETSEDKNIAGLHIAAQQTTISIGPKVYSASNKIFSI